MNDHNYLYYLKEKKYTIKKKEIYFYNKTFIHIYILLF